MMPGPEKSRSLTAFCRRIRRHCVEMSHHARCAHLGSSLSIVEILAVLYKKVLNLDAGDPANPLRDRLIVSKGHASAAVYAVLAECGFFPSEWLKTYYQNGSRLSGHVSHHVPGIEVSTGSLGHGLSIGAGMAFVDRGSPQPRVFVLLSDGECDEGTIWEAALFAGHHHLSNLVVIVDYNKIQAIGKTADILDLEPFLAKWQAFGWDARDVDGHQVKALEEALSEVPFTPGKPSCLIAHTTKGKGISFMENSVLWHYRNPQGEEYAKALAELGVDE